MNDMNPWSDLLQSNQSNLTSSPWDSLLQTGDSEGSVLPGKTQVTQTFGTYNPIEPTAGHLAGDTNFAADMYTPVSLPKGEWEILEAYNAAKPVGAPGNYADNQGYGNDVVAQNTRTGEKLRFLHLANTNVQPGQIISNNIPVGYTGSSGNSTGSNLGVEYVDPNGQLGEVLNSPYGRYFNTQ